MVNDWGKYETNENGVIYNVLVDKPRQTGFASLAVFRELSEVASSLVSTDSELSANLRIVAEEMRHFVVGNTSKSKIKFYEALNYVLSHHNDNFPAYVIQLVELCERIVNSLDNNEEIIDDLLEVCSELEIYRIEDSIEIMEA